MPNIPDVWRGRMHTCSDASVLSRLDQRNRKWLMDVGVPAPEEVDLEVCFDGSERLAAIGAVGIYRVAGLPDLVWGIRISDQAIVEYDLKNQESRLVNSSLARMLGFLDARSRISADASVSAIEEAVRAVLASDPQAIIGDGSSFWEEYYEVLLEEVQDNNPPPVDL